MDYLRAMERRHSQRRYTDKSMDQKVIRSIEESIAKYNEESGLHMQLVLDEPEVFSKFKTSYGIFKGVRHYIALVGKKSDSHRMEKEGRYGELLVLEAAAMGLDTCWLGTSYDRSGCGCVVESDETLDLVIAIGYGREKLSFREKMMQNMMHRNEKTLDEIFSFDSEPPEWVKNGMQAVLAAPTARNLRPFKFKYKNKSLTIECTGEAKRVMVDIGIAKVHFEIGSAAGAFEMGSPAKFNLKSDQSPDR